MKVDQRKVALTQVCAALFAEIAALSDVDQDIPSPSSDEWLHTMSADLVAYVRARLGYDFIVTTRQVVMTWCRVRKNKQLQLPKKDEVDHGSHQ